MIEIQKAGEEIIVKLPLTAPRSKVRIIKPDGTYIQTPTSNAWDQRCWVEWMISYKKDNDLVELGEILEIKARIGQIGLWELLLNDLIQIEDFFTETDYFKQPSSEPENVGEFAGYDVFRCQKDIFGYERLLDTGMKVVSYTKPGEYTVALQPHLYVYLPINPGLVFEPDVNRFLIGERQLRELQFPRTAESNEKYTWYPTDSEIREITLGLAHTDRARRDGLIETVESLII